jgi:hypothetical protein
MYSRSQCQTSGNPALFGQLLCRNNANPAGSINHFNDNRIPGNPRIESDCNGLTARYRRITSWSQPVN